MLIYIIIMAYVFVVLSVACIYQAQRTGLADESALEVTIGILLITLMWPITIPALVLLYFMLKAEQKGIK